MRGIGEKSSAAWKSLLCSTEDRLVARSRFIN